MRAGRVAVFAFVAAVVAFCIVQDRLTAGGARRYVSLQRAAMTGGSAPVTIDGIMRPAVQQSVLRGLLGAGMAGGGVAAAGALVARRTRRG